MIFNKFSNLKNNNIKGKYLTSTHFVSGTILSAL